MSTVHLDVMELEGDRESGELHATLLANLYQTADIQRFHQRHHWHGRRHPQSECLRTAAFLGGYFSLHTFLVYALQ